MKHYFNHTVIRNLIKDEENLKHCEKKKKWKMTNEMTKYNMHFAQVKETLVLDYIYTLL